MIQRDESHINQRDTRLITLPIIEWDVFERDLQQHVQGVELFVVEQTIYARGPLARRTAAAYFADGWRTAAYRCAHAMCDSEV